MGTLIHHWVLLQISYTYYAEMKIILCTLCNAALTGKVARPGVSLPGWVLL
jgi:hypothetical protein